MVGDIETIPVISISDRAGEIFLKNPLDFFYLGS